MQQQIEARDVWFAWVRYEESPMQGKNRPVLVADVDGDEALVLAVPFKYHGLACRLFDIS